jgi:hypothetical protein
MWWVSVRVIVIGDVFMGNGDSVVVVSVVVVSVT